MTIRTYGAGEVIFDFESVPTMFYVIKSGRVRFEDNRLFAEKLLAEQVRPGSGVETSLIKVEGEWFGFESFLCGPYATMT